MPGRPLTPIGAHGKVTTREAAPRLFEAITRVRDPDGVSRRVKRQGASRSAAENALRKALAERRHTAGSTLTATSRVREAAQLVEAQWQARAAAGEMAPRTVEAYADTLRLHVLPALGELRLREATAGACEAWLVALRQHKGPATCKRARAVLSAVLGHAARMDAIASNPVPELSRIPGGRARTPRAMTRDERAAWLDWMDSHVALPPRRPGQPPRRLTARHPGQLEHTIASRALGDITRFMLATGARIGETMAVSWDEVDLHAGTVAIRWHLVRVRGDGLQRVAGAKSEAGDRVLRLPSWAIDMLLRRRVDNEGALPVFPDSLGGWRDPNLVMRWIRWSRAEAGFDWVTSHVWRQTVITVLDEAGLPTREVADQVGHSQIVQTQEYMARRVASDRAAEALEDLL